MLASRRGTLRHPKFEDCVSRLSKVIPNAREIIDGAVWEIEHDPTRFGTFIRDIGVWEVRLERPPLLIFYSLSSRRFVHMLTMISSDGKLVF